jgi:hypothetical protein
LPALCAHLLMSLVGHISEAASEAAEEAAKPVPARKTVRPKASAGLFNS